MDVVSKAIDIYEIVQDPGNWTNWAALGADIVCTALPGLTGGGRIVKGITKLDAIDLGKTIDKGCDLGRTIDKSLDATKYLDNLPKVAKTLDKGTDITQTAVKVERTVLHHSDPMFMGVPRTSPSPGCWRAHTSNCTRTSTISWSRGQMLLATI